MNSKYADILKLARIQILTTVIFIFFKLIRPSVLKSNAAEIFKTILLSLPNFFEAIIGILTLTGIALVLNNQLHKSYKMDTKYLYIVISLLAGVFVVLRELNIITLRSNKTMDKNDLIFSGIGLVTGYCIIRFLKPHVPSSVKHSY